jgi:hypothetical protein
MGASVSKQSSELENKVYQSLRGVLLRGSKKISPIQELLSASLYHTYPSAQNRLPALYVVKNGSEMESFGLLPSFQGGNDRFIVRPLRKEFLTQKGHFREADRNVQEGTTAIYSVLSSLLAITGLALSSHTQSYKDLLSDIGKDTTTSSGNSQSKSIDYPSILMSALQTYSSQRFTRNINTRDRNIAYAIDSYSNLVPVMLQKIEKRIVKRRTSESSDGPKGNMLFHTSLLSAIDSFSICSSNTKGVSSLKNILVSLGKGSELDGIIGTMYRLLSKDVVRAWLEQHPKMKRRLEMIIAGTARSARLIAREDSGLNDLISEIVEKMREQVENACKTNESLSAYSSKKNVLVKKAGTDRYEYSKEANQMIVRIYQVFEKATRTMQTDILQTFLSIFDITDKEVPKTVNIQSNQEGKSFISVKPSIINSGDPGSVMMNGLLTMIEAYTKYIITIERAITSTINRKTRVL